MAERSGPQPIRVPESIRRTRNAHNTERYLVSLAMGLLAVAICAGCDGDKKGVDPVSAKAFPFVGEFQVQHDAYGQPVTIFASMPVSDGPLRRLTMTAKSGTYNRQQMLCSSATVPSGRPLFVGPREGWR